MGHKRTLLFSILAILLALTAIGGAVLAQSSTSFDLEWHVIGSGGQPVSSASYVVNSTVGQGVASSPYLMSDNFAISGGYWFGDGITLVHKVYLPLVLRNLP